MPAFEGARPITAQEAEFGYADFYMRKRRELRTNALTEANRGNKKVIEPLRIARSIFAKNLPSWGGRCAFMSRYAAFGRGTHNESPEKVLDVVNCRHYSGVYILLNSIKTSLR